MISDIHSLKEAPQKTSGRKRDLSTLSRTTPDEGDEI